MEKKKEYNQENNNESIFKIKISDKIDTEIVDTLFNIIYKKKPIPIYIFDKNVLLNNPINKHIKCKNCSRNATYFIKLLNTKSKNNIAENNVNQTNITEYYCWIHCQNII